VAREEGAEERDRPFLERFREQRVIGVGARALRDGPCGIPIHAVVVDEQAHQLGDRD
jgi:hypothetical protein